MIRFNCSVCGFYEPFDTDEQAQQAGWGAALISFYRIDRELVDRLVKISRTFILCPACSSKIDENSVRDASSALFRKVNDTASKG